MDAVDQEHTGLSIGLSQQVSVDNTCNMPTLNPVHFWSIASVDHELSSSRVWLVSISYQEKTCSSDNYDREGARRPVSSVQSGRKILSNAPGINTYITRTLSPPVDSVFTYRISPFTNMRGRVWYLRIQYSTTKICRINQAVYFHEQKTTNCIGLLCL